jgi:hypothetical protein
MSDVVALEIEAPPVAAQIVQMRMGAVVSRLMTVAVTLKLPDLLDEGPKTAEELASLTGTHAPALYRLMRTLASLGFFSEDAEHRFTLRPLGAAVKTGTPGYAVAMLLGGELFTRSLDNFLYSVRTGMTAFEHVFGVPVFDWLSAHPEEAALFNGAMVGFHGMEPPAVAAAYDFSVFGTIVDVGGSTGNLLTTVLSAHPGPRGILYDLPHVVEKAPELIEERRLMDRIRIEGGSFFNHVPAGADAYILSHVIHDWNPDQCLTILGNCRRAMNSESRLLLVEMVLPEGDRPHPGKLLDMVMLALPGGEERTASQYETLLNLACFEMTRVVPTASPVSIVEAVPR